MNAPNLISLVAGLVVVLPAVSLAITQQAPPNAYWWSALVTGIIGAIVKALQVYAASKTTQLPTDVAGVEAPKKSKVQEWLRG